MSGEYVICQKCTVRVDIFTSITPISHFILSFITYCSYLLRFDQ